MPGLIDILYDRLDERHQKKLAFDREKRAFYQGIMNDPERSDHDVQLAEQEYLKLLSPELKQAHQKSAPIVRGLHKIGEMLGLVGGGGPREAPQEATAAPVAMDAETEATVGSAPAPIPRAQRDAFVAGPQFDRIRGADKAARARRDASAAHEANIADIKKMLPPGQAQEAASAKEFGVASSTFASPSRQRVSVKLKDGTEVPALFDPRAAPGESYAALDGTLIDPATIESAGSGGTFAIRQGKNVSRADAIKMAEGGAAFHGQDGSVIDPASLPGNMALQAMIAGDKVFYIPISPDQKVFTVGGVRYAAMPTELKTPESAVELGLANPGTNTFRSEVAVGPDGQLTTNTLPGGSTPKAPGMTGAALTPAAAPVAAPASGSPPLVRPTTRTAPAKPPAAGIRGVPVGAYEKFQQTARPVREALVQVFGDPDNAGFVPLTGYAKFADNKQSRERIGQALRFALDEMAKSTAGAGVSAEAGPIAISTGGVGDFLQNYFHLPQTIAAQKQAQVEEMLGKLKPEEKQAFNATISSLSTLAGLRRLSGASASNASIRALERELPLIGINSFSAKDFGDQAGRLAEIAMTAGKTLPAGFLDDKLLERVKQSRPKATTKKVDDFGPKSAPKTADEFYKLHPELAPQ